MFMTKDIFSNYYSPEPMSGCWIWVNSRDKNGYGQFGKPVRTKNGSSRKAHRISWMLYNQGIDDGFLVCHHCDNPSCVNPDHLFVGSQKQNLADCSRKGRTLTGEKCPTSKLKESQVLSILSDDDKISNIAVKFNVHYMTIWDIKNGRRWKYLSRSLSA